MKFIKKIIGIFSTSNTKNEIDKSKCICELNASGQQLSGWCVKHHTDWM